jgi:CspA family cold shock protein
MATGTIKKVVSDRGFGFIAAEDGKEYFFHRNELDSSLDFDRLNGGEKVTFEVQASQGPARRSGARRLTVARPHG